MRQYANANGTQTNVMSYRPFARTSKNVIEIAQHALLGVITRCPGRTT